MLSSSLWMQEPCLPSWRFAGTLCNTSTQWPAPAGRIKLRVAQAPCRGSLWPLHAVCFSLLFAKLISLAGLPASFAFFTWPTLPWVGLQFRCGLVSIPLSPSVWQCSVGWWPLQGYHGYLLPCCASPGSTNLEAPTPKLSVLMMSLNCLCFNQLSFLRQLLLSCSPFLACTKIIR